MNPVAVYVHTPFCPSKCGYCDFNSYAMTGEIIERTTRATVQEIRRSPWAGRPAKTIFFGGGTPTFLSEAQLMSILQAVIETHPPTADCEITSEANPGTVDMPKFRAMREGGFNRISLGAQSFVPEELQQLGRVHASSHIGRAVAAAREAGFDNINLDLMFALPGQSMRVWEQNLRHAVSLKTEHLSLYCLTIEPNTRFYKLNLKGMLHLPDDDAQVAMYDVAVAMAREAGFEHYEISNFARPGRESLHNLCYWRSEEYLSYGPGAVGCFDSEEGRRRYTNMKHPEGYSLAVESGADLWCENELLEPDSLRLERIMMGIRLAEGLPLDAVKLEDAAVAKLHSDGWVKTTETHLCLTSVGRHFCSEVALALA